VTAHDAARVVVLGAGRGSAELVDFLRDTHPGADVVVLDDAHPNGPRAVEGCPVIGPLGLAAELCAAGARVAMGIANSRQLGLRCDIAARLAIADERWLTCVHPTATVSPRAAVGAGAVVYPGARVAVDARVGRLALVYYNAVVHHDAAVEDGAVLCAGVLLAGGVTVGEGSYLGAGCVVKEGVRIGRRALVGMGAVVTRDVPDGARVVGVPARPLPGP
jgi:sugar O-acyltransferase (sialic acid O-acetyltransferase NeuD family)